MSDKPGELQVREVLATFQDEALSLPADADLIDSRLITSLSFITLVQNLIDVSGREPDLDAVPIERLRTIAGLAEVFYTRDPQAVQVNE